MRTDGFDGRTTRRAALGLVGGFVALGLGAAPVLHRRAALDVELSVVDYQLADAPAEPGTPVGVDGVAVRLDNHDAEFVPLFFTWDQKRKTRHNWDIDAGPSPLPTGETAQYRLVAPGPEGRINTGYPAQLTVFERGEQRWASIQTRFEP